MSFLPIAQRELRLAARRPRTHRTRLIVGGLASAGTLLLMLPSFRGLRPAADTGRGLFLWLSVAAMLFAMVVGAFITADSISEEKREGTLGLLFLTPLRAYDIVLGKLLATSLNPFYGLLAIFPLLGLSILFGGVTGGEFLRVTLVLTNSLFLSLAVGLLLSSLFRDGRKAALTALLFLGLASAVPLLVPLLHTKKLDLDSVWSVFSPAAGFLLALDDFHKNAPVYFWNGFALQHLAAWTCLALSSWATPRFWKREPAGESRSRLIPQFIRGSARSKRRATTRNPLRWLAAQNPINPIYGWGLVIPALLLWWAGWTAVDLSAVPSEAIYAMMIVIHVAIRIWVAFDVTRSLAELRRSGMMELLLVSPVGIRRIVQGQILSMRQRFLPQVLVIVGLNVVFMFSGALGSGSAMPASALFISFLTNVVLFVADVLAITWVGLWQSVIQPNSPRAFFRTLIYVFLLPWFAFVALVPMVALLIGGFRSVEIYLIFWFMVRYFGDLLFCGLGANRTFARFRKAAVLAA